ncbi:peptidoglycan-binding domain-containing protein [Streptomyces hokutonensis]|uniref:peptidoglycan-binding domain-containing protein n=1 Tax=Streptomyces hokutonensis TaxID=1306990 RepID=UPI000382F28C|nr:peptidoglycan-binding protein [Streptomyces hokutonensis]
MFSKRAKATAGTIAALTAAVLGLSASPASASGTYSGLAYVYGAGVFADDWGNEGIVDQSHNTVSNATCLWQKILYADGFLAAGDIDGDFGPQTAAATELWQSVHTTAEPDGSAGQITWTAAGKLLRNSSNTTTGNTVSFYNGSLYDFYLTRDSNGYYHFPDGNVDDRIAGYNYRTC